jgi:hypothetical protein
MEDEARRISERTKAALCQGTRPEARQPRRGQDGGEGTGGPIGLCRESKRYNPYRDPGGAGERR